MSMPVVLNVAESAGESGNPTHHKLSVTEKKAVSFSNLGQTLNWKYSVFIEEYLELGHPYCLTR